MNGLDIALGVFDQPWRDQAACRDMDTLMFFPFIGVERFGRPDSVRKAQEAAALAVCRGCAARAECPVRAECRDMALETATEYGIFGGWRFHVKEDRARARKERP